LDSNILRPSSEEGERTPGPSRKRLRQEGRTVDMDGRSRSQVAESLLEHSYERRLSSEQNGEEKNGDGGVHGLKQRSDRINFAKGDYSDSSTSNGSTNGHAKKADFRTYSTHDQEVLRLLGQYLQNLGLTKTVQALVSESGCEMEQYCASTLRENVMSGSWDEAEASLNELVLMVNQPEALKRMQFLLREQKYLELVQDNKPLEALQTLRQDITPLNHNIPRVHELSRCLMTNGKKELCRMAGWSGKGKVSRQALMDQLQMFLPPSVMLPPRRLTTLLDQAVGSQVARCPCHNLPREATSSSMTLLVDHVCNKDNFPCETSQILGEHCDEVWFCRFSPNGKRLATSSKDSSVIIWDVDLNTYEVKFSKVLEMERENGQVYGVSCVAWSSDNRHLAACGPDDPANDEVWIWNVESNSTEPVQKLKEFSEDVLTTIAWHKDGKKLVTGGSKGQFYLCDIGGALLSTWEGVRVQGLAFRDDGKVLAADVHNRIRAYDFDDVADRQTLTSSYRIKEDHPIMSFTCDRSGRLALLNIAHQGVHLWDLEDRVLIRRFQGLTQGHCTIHSCFGGVDERFIASGSEDHKVYIWSVEKETPVMTLPGHTRTVNCVHWNPACPSMIASASDDGTVRIWTPKSSSGGRAPSISSESMSNGSRC
ncbi:hypothetical protein RvY_09513, partial [Ramazzottius varieornatus]